MKFKKLIGLLVVTSLALVLTACGKSEVGTYKYHSKYNTTMTISLEKNGEFKFVEKDVNSLKTDEKTGYYWVNGDKIKFTNGKDKKGLEEFNATIKGRDKIVLKAHYGSGKWNGNYDRSK